MSFKFFELLDFRQEDRLHSVHFWFEAATQQRADTKVKYHFKESDNRKSSEKS